LQFGCVVLAGWLQEFARMLFLSLLHSVVAVVVARCLPESVCVDGNVRYFAFGSNLLRSKMVGCAPRPPTTRVLTDSAS
jgi:hypothetical protein